MNTMKAHTWKRTLLPRLLLLLPACAVGGAIINVAVAWGCASFATPSSATNMGTCPVGQNENWTVVRTGLCGIVTVTSEFYDTPGPSDVSLLPMQVLSWGTLVVDPRSTRSGVASYYWERETMCGWPLLSLNGVQTIHNIREPKFGVSLAPGESLRLLPYHALWPGFAINTIFYAAIIWLLFAAPGFVRRRIRTRRGQCPACAYPVGSSTVCTECGRPVTARAYASRTPDTLDHPRIEGR